MTRIIASHDICQVVKGCRRAIANEAPGRSRHLRQPHEPPRPYFVPKASKTTSHYAA